MCPHAQIQREVAFGSKRIRCVLVHDHVLLRQGLRRLLQDEPDLDVVAEAGNAADAIRRVFEFRPEVVIADAGVFGCSPVQAEQLILHESPLSKVLFLAANDAGVQDINREASCAKRRTSAEELVEMVRAHGAMAAEAIPARKRSTWAPDDLVHPRKRLLTEREREVLKLLAEGRTVRSAASVLGLSAKTVDAHKFNLMRKLGIHNKAELVMWAIQKKVVKVPAS